jgi:hypothetical protein
LSRASVQSSAFVFICTFVESKMKKRERGVVAYPLELAMSYLLQAVAILAGIRCSGNADGAEISMQKTSGISLAKAQLCLLTQIWQIKRPFGQITSR